MADLNGIEFTKRFRTFEGNADTPVIMVTASEDETLRTTALESGVNDFLNKPFGFAELQERVAKMLASG